MTFDTSSTTLHLLAFKGDTLEEYPPPLYGYGMSLSIDDDAPVTISHVIDGSPADEEGVGVGEEVLDINGTNPADVSPGRRINLVLTTSAGRELELS